LINNFSILALKTNMAQVLQGTDPGESLSDRAELFTLLRSNKGLMLMDNTNEDLVMLNTPISGLDALQAQSQEQMCSVSHTPAVILLGIAPSGFGNVAEGEIRAYYDWIAAQQETYWRKPIEIVVNILQLIRYGVIDPDIVVSFQPLYQMTPKELSEIRKSDADRDSAYVTGGILDVTEIRERLARDPESGYQGIDTGMIPGGDELGDDEDEGQQREEGDIPS
jgi:phage-related protein (TIGR01555 family)